MSQEKPRRPDGVGASAVLWFLAGLYTIYSGYTNDIARAFGVPKEFLNVILIFEPIGGLIIINAYGLWTGKSYSYWLSLIIPFFAVGINLALIILYASAPSELNLTSNSAPALVHAIGWVIWLFIYRWYFGKPYVKAYLGRSKSQIRM
jgi:hypothetical protein